MAKLDGERASYFIELGKSLSNDADRRLKASQYPTDLTKTCWSIVKLMYPDVSTRAKMLMSLLPNETNMPN
ncbi:unnamed protein product [Rotaria magnacalcarata]